MTVTWLADGSRRGTLLVPGSNILDIEIEPDLIPPPTPPIQADKEQRQLFVDPAIVSYQKGRDAEVPTPPDSSNEVSRHQEPEAPTSAETFPPQSPPSATYIPQMSHGTVVTPQHQSSHYIGPSQASDNAAASATLSEPFNDLSLAGPSQQVHDLDIDDSPHHTAPHTSKPSALGNSPATKNLKKRGKRGGSLRGAMGSTINQTTQDLEDTPNPLSAQKRRSINNKKGWRQTPLLEEPTLANIRLPRAHQAFTSPATASMPTPSPQSRLAPGSARGGRRRIKEEEDQNGWATGEATDIQDMGDFDFEENHKKFDKRKVFDQIRRDDTTADEARLVSFNRLALARAGTAGGKNLHYTENVLDSPAKKAVGHSSGDSDVEISEARISSGRSMSRASTKRKVPSRKGSALVNASLDHVASPKLRSDSMTTLRKQSLNQPNVSLVISSSKLPCPCVTPLQMLELEQLATNELDLTEDMMTENAARSIAETAYSLTLEEDHQSTSALVVILAGNHKTGSRAIAAGRHLRNHNTRVVLCVLGIEREADLLDSVRRQLKIFRNCGGQAIKQNELVKTLRRLKSQPSLIMDALLGIHISFDDLRAGEYASYFQLVSWADSSDVDIMALDVPSGVDASTGKYFLLFSGHFEHLTNEVHLRTTSFS